MSASGKANKPWTTILDLAHFKEVDGRQLYKGYKLEETPTGDIVLSGQDNSVTPNQRIVIKLTDAEQALLMVTLQRLLLRNKQPDTDTKTGQV